MNVAAIAQSSAATPAATARSAAPAATNQPKLLDRLPPLVLSPEALAKETASLAGDVGKKFRGLGVQTPPDPVLGTDYSGQVRVSNNHPDKEKIERLFTDNPELRDRFAKISANASVLRAAEHYGQFAQDYARLQANPAAQSALVGAEVARNKAVFQMAISATGADTFFVGLAGVTA